MGLNHRQLAYFGLRGIAAVGFVLAAVVVPRGLPAALLAGGCGVLAVLTCIGVNAGGPGERAGAALQDRRYAAMRAPQGQWPPYDTRVVEGEVVPAPPRREPPGR